VHGKNKPGVLSPGSLHGKNTAVDISIKPAVLVYLTLASLDVVCVPFSVKCVVKKKVGASHREL